MEVGAQPGNENSAKGKDWKLAIKRALARRGDGDYRKGLDRVADRVVAMAEAGDTQAWREVGERFDGKPKQSLEVSGDESAPLVTRIELVPLSGNGKD